MAATARPVFEELEQVDPLQEGDDLVDGLAGEVGQLTDLGGIEFEDALLIREPIEAQEDPAIGIALLLPDNIRQTNRV